ncbi:MAG: enoyl-CoA hydratase [Pseudomonadota bacterium]
MNVETGAPLVLHEMDEGVLTLTMNRPKQLNALSRPLMAEMLSALNEAHETAAVKVIVIAGAGNGFCPGHDLKEIRGTPKHEFYQVLLADCAQLMLRIHSARQPVIARVHGIATAAGAQMVATCDLAVAAPEAKFSTPGVNIGLFCNTPMVGLSRAVARKQMMRMLLTGDMIDAEKALSIGLVSDVAKPGRLDEMVYGQAHQIASKSSRTLAIGKEAFYKQVEMPIEEAYKYASDVMAMNMGINDAAEGIDAFIEKRDPTWSDS